MATQTSEQTEHVHLLRARVHRARRAAVTARLARSAAREAAEAAGALAPERSAADGEVIEARRRWRAVQGIRPARLAHAFGRRRGAVERAARAEALTAAIRRRDEVVSQAQSHLDRARRLDRQADDATATAAALPRLLDELDAAIRAGGGADADRLAAADATIDPPLTSELALTRALQATHHARERIDQAGQLLIAAHAWHSGDGREAMAAITASVLMLRRDVPRCPRAMREATDSWLCWSAARAGGPVEAQAALEQARCLLGRLDVVLADLTRRRAQARHLLAGARALRIEILAGAAA